MKKSLFKKVACIAMGSALAVAPLTACGGIDGSGYKGTDIAALYENSDKKFEFFAYRTLSDGHYYMDGKEYFTRDLRTVEDYKTYKDAGFTMLFLTPTYNGIDVEAWETSPTKKSMDNARAAGLTKIIFNDGTLGSMAYDQELLTRYTEAELLAKVKECMRPYFNEKGFYGLNIGDEPSYLYTKSYGAVIKAIKQAAKDLTQEIGAENIQNDIGASGEIYVHVNFLPIDAGGFNTRFPKYETDEYGEIAKDENGNDKVLNFRQSYTKYIEDFVTEMDAKRFAVDIYYFRGSGLYPGSYANIQLLAELAKKHNTDMSFCLQSFEMYNGNTLNYRRVDKSDMRMEIESLISVGVDHFAYYTYLSDYNNTSAVRAVDDCAFIDYEGNPTQTYYDGKEIMAMVKKFQNVVLNYDYQGCRMYTKQDGVPTFGVGPYLSSRNEPVTNTAITFDNSYEFAKVKDVKFDNDVMFLSEMKDTQNDLYMYFVQNCVDPMNSKLGRTEQVISVTFGEEVEWVAEYDAGELTYVKLEEGGVYTKTLSAGFGTFVIPLAGK